VTARRKALAIEGDVRYDRAKTLCFRLEGDMKCNFCGANAQYRDPHTGEYICLMHSRLQVIAQRRADPAEPLSVRAAAPTDRDRIAELALYFWDETEVECFGGEYDVCDLPALVACRGSKDSQIVGLASYAIEGDEAKLVMLNVLPGYQGRGAGRALIETLEGVTRARDVTRIVVATSNDDLPALYLYQRCGFRLTGVEVSHLVEHHGGEEAGFAGVPVRDEIQLEKCL
jgi:ribosomal protein S18 acetylase RimI-like enzyme